MRIGGPADETRVSRRLLRHDEEQGLLRPARSPNGYRGYAASDVTGVRRIRALLAAGLPTSVIVRILHRVHDDGGHLVPSPCPGLVGHLRREPARMADSIAQLQVSQHASDVIINAVRPVPAAVP